MRAVTACGPWFWNYKSTKVGKYFPPLVHKVGGNLQIYYGSSIFEAINKGNHPVL